MSLVNYRAGVNIANAASVATRFLSSGSDDINITTQFHSADSIGDVMGYYYPVRQEIPALTIQSGQVLTSTACQNVATLTVFPNSRGYWLVQASMNAQIWNQTDFRNSINLYLTTGGPTTCDGTPVIQECWNAQCETTDTMFIQNRFVTSTTAAEVFYLNVTTSGDTGPEFMQSFGEWISASFTAWP